MDCKKFLQLVEEKKKKILERQEAPAQWQQKLEAPAKAKAGAEDKRRKAKAAARKHRKRSSTDSDSECQGNSSDERKKSRKRTGRRHVQRRTACSRDSDYDDVSGGGDSVVKRKAHKKHQQGSTSGHSRYHRRPKNGSFFHPSDSEDVTDSRSYKRVHKHHKRKRTCHHHENEQPYSDAKKIDSRQDQASKADGHLSAVDIGGNADHPTA